METSSVLGRCKTARIIGLTLAIGVSAALLFLAAPALAETDVHYQATFVEVGGLIPGGGGSCGSATISELGHVAYQCVFFNQCGPNCEERTLTFRDGSTLVIHESIVGVISPGSSGATKNAPLFLQITQTIVGGTGRFQGATGSGTGIVNLAANAVIIASGTITFP